MNRICLAVFALAALLGTPFAAAGQGTSVAPVAPAKSGMVAYIQGDVYLNDERLPDPLVAQYPYIKESGALRTAKGRAEVFMNPGLSVHVGADSSLRMVSTQFDDTRAELTQGSAVVSTPEIDKDNRFTLSIGDAAVDIAKSGTYHFSADPAQVKVFSGLAKVKMGGRTIDVSAGRLLDLSGAAASPTKFDKNDTDALDRWAARRGELMAAANLSSARNCNTSLGFISSNSQVGQCVGSWRWNPWYNLYTYIPYTSQWCDPMWGYCYYNPMAVMMFYRQPLVYGYYGGGQASQPGAAAINRPGVAARTVNPATRPVAPSVAGSNGRGETSPGVRGSSMGSIPMGGGGGGSSMGGGGGAVGGGVSGGAPAVRGGGGAAPSGGGAPAAPSSGGAPAVSTGGGARR